MRIEEAITTIKGANLDRNSIKLLNQTDRKILNSISKGKTIEQKDQQAAIDLAKKLQAKNFSKTHKESSVIGKLIKKTKQAIGVRISSKEVSSKKPYVFPDGATYTGKVKEGKAYGKGTYTWSDGAKYVGEYKDGKRDGKGTFTFADGVKYVGEFNQGSPTGKGNYHFSMEAFQNRNGTIDANAVYGDISTHLEGRFTE